MLLAAVALLSAAALAYEILLLRLFSIAQWHHLAYMVISLALLGYGASGTLLTFARRRLLASLPASFAVGAALFALTGTAAFALAQRLPFNLLELLWDPRQPLALAAVYLLLAVPFLCAASSIGLALAASGEGPGPVYRADLLGAGAGALGIVAVLFAAEPETCLRGVGALALAAAALACLAPGRGRSPRAAAVLALAALAVPAAWPAAWLEPRLSPYKALTQTLRLPGSRVVAERSGSLGRLTLVASPEVPLRMAPGLSLDFRGEIPEQLAFFTDGAAPSAVERWDGRTFPPHLDFLPSALAYRLLDRPRVLVLDAGGGTEVLAALAHGARRVDAVEMNPQTLELLRGPYAGFSGGLYRRPEVRPHVAEARAFLAHSRERWDLIQLPLLGSSGAAAAGTALGESYLATLEAFELLLRRLEPGGLLAVSCWLRLPPRDGVKLFATAAAALEEAGVPRPGDRLALVRGWSTATLLIKNGDLDAADTAAIRRFAAERSFDLAWLPDLQPGEASRFHQIDGPGLEDAAAALLGPGRGDFLAAYKFHVAPATDDRPYFSRFFRWRSLPELLSLRGRGGTPLLESAYLALVATLLQAAVAAAVLILLPLAVLRRRPSARFKGRIGLYFFALGLAFLFVEIALLQRLTLLLGHPVYAASLVLGGFLVFAGLGAGVSSSLGRTGGRRRAQLGGMRPATAALLLTVALMLAVLVWLPRTSGALMSAPMALRAAAALAAVAPLAFVMGMPFPLGLARVAARDPAWVPWAWGVNGCASVLAPVAATLLSVHLGFTAIMALAAALYALAAWALRGV